MESTTFSRPLGGAEVSWERKDLNALPSRGAAGAGAPTRKRLAARFGQPTSGEAIALPEIAGLDTPAKLVVAPELPDAEGAAGPPPAEAA